MRLAVISSILLFFTLNHPSVNGLGDFVFYFDDSCDDAKGWTYIPVAYALSYPDWWEGRCLTVGRSAEHFSMQFNQSFTPGQLSSSFRLQIWQPTLSCGIMFSNTLYDTFEVSSSNWPEIICQRGRFTTMNSTFSDSADVWITVMPDPMTQPSSTALPPPPWRSSSSSGIYASSSSTGTSVPFPFDSSILNPSGQVIPDSSSSTADGPASGDSSGLSTPAIAGIAAGSGAVILLLAVGLYYLFKRRRQSHDDLSFNDRSSLNESLYARDAGYSDL